MKCTRFRLSIVVKLYIHSVVARTLRSARRRFDRGKISEKKQTSLFLSPRLLLRDFML